MILNFLNFLNIDIISLNQCSPGSYFPVLLCWLWTDKYWLDSDNSIFTDLMANPFIQNWHWSYHCLKYANILTVLWLVFFLFINKEKVHVFARSTQCMTSRELQYTYITYKCPESI